MVLGFGNIFSFSLTNAQEVCLGAFESDGGTEEEMPDFDECTPSQNSPYNTYYRYQNNHVPDASTAVKTIHVKFIVWQQNDGSTNWQNTTDHISRLHQIIDWVNDYYENSDPVINLWSNVPTDPISGVSVIYDRKIRIQLDEIIFEKNSSFANDDDSHKSSLLSEYPSLHNYLTIEIKPQNVIPGAFGASGGKNSNIIITSGDPSNFGYNVSGPPTTPDARPISIATIWDDDLQKWVNYRDFDFAYHNAKNLSSHFTYFYGHGPRFEPDAEPNIALTEIQTQVDYTEDCPQLLNLGGVIDPGPGDPFSKISEADSALDAKWELRGQLIDGGSTPDVEAQIFFAAGQQEYQDLYLDLMAMAPYVSEGPLIDLINIPDYPELALRNIMVANPHASRTPEVWDALINRQPPLAQSTLDDIENEQQTITAKDILEMEISELNQRYHYAMNEYLYLLGRDSVEASFGSLLGNARDLTYKVMAVEYYLGTEQLARADSMVQALPSSPYEEPGDMDVSTLKDVYTIVLNAAGYESGTMGLTSGDKSALSALYANTGDAFSRAKIRSLLRVSGEPIAYQEPVYLPEGSGKRSEGTSVNRPATFEPEIQLFPNPATDYTEIRWKWMETGWIGELEVVLIDLSGKQVHSQKIGDAQRNLALLQWDNIPAGTYIVNITSHSAIVWKGKLVVTE